MTSETYVLDSSAVVAYLGGEPGAEILQRLLAASGNRFLLHGVSIGEVYYLTLRKSGPGPAEHVLGSIAGSGLEVVRDLSDEVLRRVGLAKMQTGAPYVDCLVIALAQLRGAAVVTSDRRHFTPAQAVLPRPLVWLR